MDDQIPIVEMNKDHAEVHNDINKEMLNMLIPFQEEKHHHSDVDHIRVDSPNSFSNANAEEGMEGSDLDRNASMNFTINQKEGNISPEVPLSLSVTSLRLHDEMYSIAAALRERGEGVIQLWGDDDDVVRGLRLKNSKSQKKKKKKKISKKSNDEAIIEAGSFEKVEGDEEAIRVETREVSMENIIRPLLSSSQQQDNMKEEKEHKIKEKKKKEKKLKRSKSEESAKSSITAAFNPDTQDTVKTTSLDTISVKKTHKHINRKKVNEKIDKVREIDTSALLRPTPSFGPGGEPTHNHVALSTPCQQLIVGGTPLTVRVDSISPLIADANIVHPFVRVHILDARNGENLCTSQHTGYDFGTGFCQITFPYDVRSRQCRSPEWRQEFTFNLLPGVMEAEGVDPTIFVELLDFGFHLITGEISRDRVTRATTNGGNSLYHIAWGFLKLRNDKSDLKLNIYGDISLQLFPFSETTSAFRRIANAFIPSCFAHQAINTKGPTSYIPRTAIVPEVFRAFADIANRRVPYPVGMQIAVLPHAVKSQDCKGDVSACYGRQQRLLNLNSKRKYVEPTPYELSLEEYLLVTCQSETQQQAIDKNGVVVEGYDKFKGLVVGGNNNNLQITRAKEISKKLMENKASPFASLDYTRRRDERSLPPTVAIHKCEIRGKIHAMALSPGTNRLLGIAIATDFTNFVELRDIKNAHFPIVASLKGHADVINHISFNQTITLLASSSSDKTVKIWDISELPRIISSSEDEKLVCIRTFSHGFIAYSSIFTCNIIIVAGYDTRLHVWAIPSENEISSRRHHHLGGITSDNNNKAHYVSQASPALTFPHPYTAFFSFLLLTEKVKVWALDSMGYFMMWRVDSNERDEFEDIHMRRRMECPGATTVDVRGNVAAVGCPSAGCILIIDTNAFVTTHTILTGIHRTSSVPFALLPDTFTLVCGTTRGRLLSWETCTGELSSKREGYCRVPFKFSIDLLQWAPSNQICAIAHSSIYSSASITDNASKWRARNDGDAGGAISYIAVLGRPRQETDVVSSNDPRADDLIRGMFGGEVTLRPSRHFLLGKGDTNVNTPGDGIRPRKAEGRIDQILSYWKNLVSSHVGGPQSGRVSNRDASEIYTENTFKERDIEIENIWKNNTSDPAVGFMGHISDLQKPDVSSYPPRVDSPIGLNRMKSSKRGNRKKMAEL